MRTVKNINIDYGNNILITLNEDYEKNGSWTATAEKQTKKWFVENIKKDWNIFDIGANVGMYTALFSKLGNKTYSFEPTDTIQILKNNMHVLNFTNIDFFDYAVSNKNGKFIDNIHKIWQHTTLNQEFDFITIDKFVELNSIDKLNLIKIDTDGYDFEVLQGSINTLRFLKPVIIVELNTTALKMRNQIPEEAIKFMKDNNYVLLDILDGENYLFSSNN